MDSGEPPNLLDYYAKFYRPGMVDLSASSAPACNETTEGMDYGPPGGLPSLRDAIAALYPGLCAEDVIVTNGASEALAATAFALVRPGQRVSAGTDIYPSFCEVATRLGAVLTTDDAPLTVINNPTIPHGRLTDLRPVLRSIEATGGRLVSDEVYLDLREEAPGTPAASISRSAVSIGDLSKPLGLGGLRIGWVASRDRSVVDAISRAVQLLSGGPSILAMNFALQAVTDYGPRLAARCAAAEKNAPLLFAALEQAHWEFWAPEAGWTFLARPSEPIEPAQLQALQAAGLFLVPASAFGVPQGYRISLFAPVAHLRRALRLASSPVTYRGAVVVLAKAPGRRIGKTRLANDVGVAAAEELASAFLADTIALTEASRREITIAFTPGDSRAEFSSMAADATLVAQPEGDLGVRIGHALGQALKCNDAAVLIGSDTPQLPQMVINDAFESLKRVDVVVGPATDGGFYLIGLNNSGSAVGLFDGIEWSTSGVCQQLLENVRRMGLTAQVLDTFADIDDAKSLAAVLRYSAETLTAPRTREAARRLGLGLA